MELRSELGLSTRMYFLNVHHWLSKSWSQKWRLQWSPLVWCGGGERNGQNGHSSLQMIHILWPNIETVSELSNQIHCRLIFIALRLNYISSSVIFRSLITTLVINHFLLRKHIVGLDIQITHSLEVVWQTSFSANWFYSVVDRGYFIKLNHEQHCGNHILSLPWLNGGGPVWSVSHS